MGVKIAHRILGLAGRRGDFLAGVRPQMHRHGERAAVFHVVHRPPQRGVGGVGFRRGRQIDRGMRQRNPALGHADEFERRVRVHRDPQRVGIRQPDVLRGGNHQPPRDEARILAGMQHLRQPVERGVRIRAADRLDEGGNRVVVRVAVGIVNHRLALDGFLRHRQSQAHRAVVFRGG